jgi:hypothetical protein
MVNTPIATRSGNKVGAGKDKAGDKTSSSSERPPSSSSSSSKGEGVSVDKRLLKELITELLSDDIFLDALVDRVADKINDKLEDKITARVLEECESRFLTTERRVDSMSAEIGKLRGELAASNAAYEAKLDAQEQYQRRNNIRIFGLPEQNGENVMELVTNLCRDKLKIEIEPSLIDRCHRVGRVTSRPGETPPRPRAILVKFVSYQTRRAVLTARRQLKNTAITIGEDLTRRRHSFLREMANKVGVRNVWSADGRILWREGERILSGQFV